MHRVLARSIRRHLESLTEVVAQRLSGTLDTPVARREALAFLERLRDALERGSSDAVSRTLAETDTRWSLLGVKPMSAAATLLGSASDPPEGTTSPGPRSTIFPRLPADVLDAMPVPILFVGRDQCVAIANAACARFLGVTAEAIIGQPLNELFTPESTSWYKQRLNEGISQNPATAVARVQFSATPERDLLTTVIPFAREDQLIGWFVSLRPQPESVSSDPVLTEMLEREKVQKQKLEALLTVSQAVTSTLDHSTVLDTIAFEVRRVVQVDECTVFLIDESGVILRPVACDVMAYHDEVMAVRLRVGEGITGTVARTGIGEIVQNSESDPRAVEVPGTPAEESSLMCVPLIAREKVIGVITLARLGAQRRLFVREDLEIVTLFAAQCSAAIHNARIYAQMKTAYDELRAAQQQLVLAAKLNALGEMAGGVAHDFNNILAAILGRTQLMLRTATEPELRRQLQVIEMAALDGAHTVRRVQEFTRVRQDERFETLDINTVVEGVVEFTRPAWFSSAKRRGVTVEMHLDLGARQSVAGNASELREVFANLILNAVDAMPWGGDLFIATDDTDGRVRVSFRDTGVGMDDETRSRVFDPFFTTKEVQGTGLGLSVAYGIVTRHRGTIEVESERGVGTEFLVTMPAGQAVMATMPSPAELGPLTPHHVLVIDDEEPVLDVLADMLKTLGQDVHVAVGGEAGITAFDRLHPPVVFTDLGMPEVNGWDVALHVRSQRPGTALVLVTGWGFQLEEETAMARGVDLILTKPFTLEDVERVLSHLGEVIERRRRAA